MQSIHPALNNKKVLRKEPRTEVILPCISHGPNPDKQNKIRFLEKLRKFGLNAHSLFEFNANFDVQIKKSL